MAEAICKLLAFILSWSFLEHTSGHRKCLSHNKTQGEAKRGQKIADALLTHLFFYEHVRT